MHILYAVILAIIVFVVLNIFLPAGWAALLGALTFVLVAFGGGTYLRS